METKVFRDTISLEDLSYEIQCMADDGYIVQDIVRKAGLLIFYFCGI